MSQDDNLRDLVADVAAAYFSNSHVTPAEIPTVVQQIAMSLSAVGSAAPSAPVVEEPPVEMAAPKKITPAQVRKSITPDGLISFEDGKSYKTLKRHLTTRGLSLEAYREKWGLPKDYPSVAPNYSAARSQMAKSLGLGQLRRKEPEPVKPPVTRRPRKTAAAE